MSAKKTTASLIFVKLKLTPKKRTRHNQILKAKIKIRLNLLLFLNLLTPKKCSLDQFSSRMLTSVVLKMNSKLISQSVVTSSERLSKKTRQESLKVLPMSSLIKWSAHSKPNI